MSTLFLDARRVALSGLHLTFEQDDSTGTDPSNGDSYRYQMSLDITLERKGFNSATWTADTAPLDAESEEEQGLKPTDFLIGFSSGAGALGTGAGYLSPNGPFDPVLVQWDPLVAIVEKALQVAPGDQSGHDDRGNPAPGTYEERFNSAIGGKYGIGLAMTAPRTVTKTEHADPDDPESVDTVTSETNDFTIILFGFFTERTKWTWATGVDPLAIAHYFGQSYEGSVEMDIDRARMSDLSGTIESGAGDYDITAS